MTALPDPLKSNPWLTPYLLGWAGLAPPQPWGAAHSFALETAASYGLVRSQVDSALTDRGRQLAGEAHLAMETSLVMQEIEK